MAPKDAGLLQEPQAEYGSGTGTVTTRIEAAKAPHLGHSGLPP